MPSPTFGHSAHRLKKASPRLPCPLSIPLLLLSLLHAKEPSAPSAAFDRRTASTLFRPLRRYPTTHDRVTECLQPQGAELLLQFGESPTEEPRALVFFMSGRHRLLHRRSFSEDSPSDSSLPEHLLVLLYPFRSLTCPLILSRSPAARTSTTSPMVVVASSPWCPSVFTGHPGVLQAPRLVEPATPHRVTVAEAPRIFPVLGDHSGEFLPPSSCPCAPFSLLVLFDEPRLSSLCWPPSFRFSVVEFFSLSYKCL